MKLLFALPLILLLSAPATAQQALTVPSGQPMSLGEVLIDESSGELWVRFRFIAPQIGEGAGLVAYETSAQDMDYLCEFLVLPYLAQYALDAARVVISLSDRPVPFGSADPDATQYFDAYRPENTGCIWEAF
jgi:Family of unknown function (DUF6497)